MRGSYLNRIKANIAIYSRKNTSSLLEGNYKSIYKGKSLNFDDLREYVPGDNVKDIDWKASARNRTLLVKQFIAEKTHNVMLVLDTDKKMMAYSSDDVIKKEIALMIAGTISYLCSKSGDSVGTIYNNNDNMEYYPFRNDLYNLEKILAKYDKDINDFSTSDLNKTLEYILKHIRKSMIIFIITDLDGIENIDVKYLRELSTRNDIMIFNISDGFLFGKNVYDMETSSFIPNIFSKNKKLFELEKNMKDEMYLTCVNKISKYRISMVNVNNIEEIPMKVIRLLEDYKYANRH